MVTFTYSNLSTFLKTSGRQWFIEGWKATLTLMLLTLTFMSSALAQSPCQAHRWASGDGWRYNSSTQKWEPTTLASPSLQPKGIVRCASSAETETALENFAGVYDPSIFAINSSLTNCFNQETEVRGITVSGPQAGEEIVWFNFDIRPLAGTYQFQIITNDQVGWALYYVDPQYAQPVTAGSSNGQVYPPTPPGLSGFTGNCTTDLSRLQYADCGISGNGWSTITVPSFTKPSNYYLAMWLLDPGTGPGKSTFSNNLIYKSRYGCGGVTCALEQFGTETLTCSTNSYTVCATYFGSAGKWALSDNALVKASSYTVTTYDQNDVQVSTATSTNLATNPLFVELGTISWAAPNNDIKAVICATYPLGTAYNITLTPAGTPAGAGNDYVACTTGDSFSGPGLTAPNANAGADKTLTCTTTSITLDGSSTTAGVTYSWSGPGGFTSTAQSPSVTAAGTYTLTVSSTNGCSATDQVIVNQDIAPPANVSAGADKTLTCTTTSVTLDGSSTTPGATFSWSGPGGFTSTAQSPSVTAPGTYTLTVTNPANGCTAQDQVTVNQNITPPNANAGADKTITCITTSVTIDGSSTTAGATFSWSGPGGFTSTAQSPSVTAAGTYTLTVTNPANGCTAQDQVVVTLDADAPNANAGADKLLTCTTTSVTLNGSSTTEGATFSWSGPGGFTSTSPTPSVSAPGTYTLTVTDPSNGCTATDQVVVTQNITAPNVNAGADQLLTCVVTSVTLNGSSTTTGATFSWSGPGGFTSTSATPSVSAPGTYTLTVTDPANGCTAQDQVTVNQNITPPNANAGLDKVLTCTITSVTLDGSSTTAGVTYSWSGPGGFTSNQQSPSVSIPGTYTLTVTNPVNGCTAQDQVVITQNANLPNVSAGADKLLTCLVTSVTLNGSSTTAGATFSWSGPGGFTSTSPTPTVSTPGTYTLTVTNPVNGCTAQDQVVVNQNITPPADVSAGADKVITCIATTATLNGSSSTAGVTYSWTGPGGFASTAQNPVVTAAGTYTLTVTNPVNGCTAQDQVVVTINNTLPNVNAGLDKTLTCITTSVTLDGSSTTAGATFSWSGPGGFTSTSATPTVSTAGTYTLTVTNPVNGCTAQDQVVVTLDANAPNANAGLDKTLTCTTLSVVLNGSSTTAGVTYSWTGPGGFTSNLQSPTVNTPGTYTLTVTNPANGCTAQDQVLVAQNITAPNANAGPDKLLNCIVTSVTLNGSSTTAGATFSWSGPGGFTSTSATPTVTVPGTYTLTVTDPANGCTAQDQVIVTADFNTPVPPSTTVTQPTCETFTGTIAVITPLANHSYTLTGPGYNQTRGDGLFQGLAPGTYSLAVTSNINGCGFNVPLPITINPVPACGETLCTYTQGQYGTEGGMACTPGGQKTTYELIRYALDNWPNNTLYIGRPGRSLTIEMAVTPGHDDIQGVIDILPGGGKSTMLSGNAHAFDVPDSWLKNGRLTNTLLAQTITLGLNLGITTNLANFELRSDLRLVTAAPLHGCNTGSTDIDACSYSAYSLSGSAVIQYLYNNVWDPVDNRFEADGGINKQATVYELFQLASAALGGVTLPAGVTMDAIAGLEDQINNIFDECQVFIGYMTSAQYNSLLVANGCTLPTTTFVDPSARVEASDLKVAAYPNPYNSNVRFNFTSPVSGKASLEVYDLVGRRLAVIFEGHVDGGMQKVVNYNVPSAQRVPMIYRLSVGGKTSFGKLLPGSTD